MTSTPSRRATLRLAVVIPTLNEQAAIEATLESIGRQTWPAERVVVSDGGSSDRTVAIAEEWGAVVLRAPRGGRGCQVAHAIESLDEDVVLIAHADMLFPIDALERVRSFLVERPDCPGGCLGHRFDRRGFSYRWIEWYDRLRGRLGAISYGDQAQFFRRAPLVGNGGFPDQSIMEDMELSHRLRRLGRPAYLDHPVTVSARRFERLGYFQTVWCNFRLRQTYRRHGLAACGTIYERYYVNAGSNKHCR